VSAIDEKDLELGLAGGPRAETLIVLTAEY
jgi:hypothetical protein